MRAGKLHGVVSANHVKHITMLYSVGQMQSFLMQEQVVHIVTNLPYRNLNDSSVMKDKTEGKY
jgi:hypothetical protein